MSLDGRISPQKIRPADRSFYNTRFTLVESRILDKVPAHFHLDLRYGIAPPHRLHPFLQLSQPSLIHPLLLQLQQRTTLDVLK